MTGMTTPEVDFIEKTYFRELVEELKTKGRVHLPGLGILSYDAASTRVTFRTSTVLREKLYARVEGYDKPRHVSVPHRSGLSNGKPPRRRGRASGEGAAEVQGGAASTGGGLPESEESTTIDGVRDGEEHLHQQG